MMEAILVFATFFGPIAAVQAQKWIERATELSRRKQWIFETLMATRATRLDPSHVRALNQIDLDFSGTNHLGFRLHQTDAERDVIDKWREYADILNQTTPEGDQPALAAWHDRADEGFINLLQAIATAQRHHFDKVQLRRGIYYPKGFSDAERRQQFTHEALARVLAGVQPIAMNVMSFPQPTEESAAQLKEVQARLISAISDDGHLRIKPVEPKA